MGRQEGRMDGGKETGREIRKEGEKKRKERVLKSRDSRYHSKTVLRTVSK